VGSMAQQVEGVLERATASSADFVKEWSPAKSSRLPLFPPQALKLRNVDIVIVEERCKGCKYCIQFCPRKVLEEGKKLNQIGVHPPRVKDSSLCVGCSVCEEICPDFAIFLVDKESSPKYHAI
jgi:2-oxoglutarate ferredoxin oxidoreductase subunit delta